DHVRIFSDHVFATFGRGNPCDASTTNGCRGCRLLRRWSTLHRRRTLSPREAKRPKHRTSQNNDRAALNPRSRLHISPLGPSWPSLTEPLKSVAIISSCVAVDTASATRYENCTKT